MSFCESNVAEGMAQHVQHRQVVDAALRTGGEAETGNTRLVSA